MDRQAIENYVIKVLTEELRADELPIKLNFFKHLWHNHTLDQERVLKGCINHFYDKQYKLNNCVSKYTVMDTAIEFEVSDQMVRNVIYKFRHIRLDF